MSLMLSIRIEALGTARLVFIDQSLFQIIKSSYSCHSDFGTSQFVFLARLIITRRVEPEVVSVLMAHIEERVKRLSNLFRKEGRNSIPNLNELLGPSAFEEIVVWEGL